MAVYANAVFSRLSLSALMLLSLLLCTLVSPVRAESSPLRALVPVKDHSEQEMLRGFREGMRQVIAQHSEWVASGSSQQLIQRAEDYVVSFRYLSNQPSSYPWVLAMSFHAPAMRIDVTPEQGLAALERNNPVADVPVLWLLVSAENSGSDYIVGGDPHPRMAAALSSQARDARVALIVPRMDSQDRQQVHTQTLKAKQLSALQHASERYASSEALLGHLQHQHGQWQVEWSYGAKGTEALHWQTRAASAEQAIAAGLRTLRQVSRGAREHRQVLQVSLRQ